jgi:hypothetical protein
VVDGRRRNTLTAADKTAISVSVAAAVAGIALMVLSSGSVALVIGACLVGVAGIAVVALVFLLVGESEDRDLGSGPD